MCGIQFEDDQTFKTNRQKTKLYVDGFAHSLLRFIVGFDVFDKKMIRDLASLTARKKQELDLDSLFSARLFQRKWSLKELEHEMADMIWVETNRIFQIVDKVEEEKIRQHLYSLRELISVAQGRTVPTGFHLLTTVYHIRRLVKELSPVHTALVLLSHLALSGVVIENLARYNGKWQGLELHDLLDPRLRYLPVIHEGNLCIINRHHDSTNNQNNRGFGPFGMQCPGAGYALEFLRQSLDFFSALDITLEGAPKLSPYNSTIQNAQDIFVTFKMRAKEPVAVEPVVIDSLAIENP